MKLWKLLFAATLAGLMFTINSACADALDGIMKSGQIRIAIPEDFPPFGSVGTDMQPQGYDIDVAKLIAKGLGVKLKLVPVTSANRIPYLLTHKVDLVISSLGKNAEREKTIDFSRAYAPFFLAVFGPPKAPIHKMSDIAEKTVGVTRGSVEDLALTKLAPSTTTIKRFEDNNTTISAYLSGQVPLIATGNVVIAAVARRDPGHAPVEKVSIKNSPCYIGLNKGENKLKAKVNALIGQGISDGTLDKLSHKWFGMPLPKLPG